MKISFQQETGSVAECRQLGDLWIGAGRLQIISGEKIEGIRITFRTPSHVLTLERVNRLLSRRLVLLPQPGLLLALREPVHNASSLHADCCQEVALAVFVKYQLVTGGNVAGISQRCRGKQPHHFVIVSDQNGLRSSVGRLQNAFPGRNYPVAHNKFKRHLSGNGNNLSELSRCEHRRYHQRRREQHLSRVFHESPPNLLEPPSSFWILCCREA